MSEYVFYDASCPDHQRSSVTAVHIPEHALEDTEYHNYTWPCAVELSRYVVEHRKPLCDKKFLEIGSGTALPSAVAASLGFRVAVTDQSSALHVCRRTLESNKLLSSESVAVASFEWADEQSFLNLIANPTFQPGFDVILCSDCYYDDAVIADVTVTLSMLLRQWPNAYVLCAYQVRDVEWLSEIDTGLRAFQLRRTPLMVNESVKCVTRQTGAANSADNKRRRKHLCGVEIVLWRIERIVS